MKKYEKKFVTQSTSSICDGRERKKSSRLYETSNKQDESMDGTGKKYNSVHVLMSSIYDCYSSHSLMLKDNLYQGWSWKFS